MPNDFQNSFSFTNKAASEATLEEAETMTNKPLHELEAALAFVDGTGGAGVTVGVLPIVSVWVPWAPHTSSTACILHQGLGSWAFLPSVGTKEAPGRRPPAAGEENEQTK